MYRHTSSLCESGTEWAAVLLPGNGEDREEMANIVWQSDHWHRISKSTRLGEESTDKAEESKLTGLSGRNNEESDSDGDDSNRNETSDCGTSKKTKNQEEEQRESGNVMLK